MTTAARAAGARGRFCGRMGGAYQLTHGGMDLSGRMVEVVLPPEALRILGKDFGFKIRLPKIAATPEGRLPDSHFG